MGKANRYQKNCTEPQITPWMVYKRSTRKRRGRMKLAIIDGSSYFYRSFFGTPEDPVAGMRAMILSALDALQPDRTIVALDHGRETFRNQIYPAYKANRPPSPEGYSDAKRAMETALTEMAIQTYSVPMYEADDIIGTLCANLDTTQEAIILSKDKDLMQLVRPGTPNGDGSVSLWYDGKWTGVPEVIEKFGVIPPRVIEVLGLSGDSADGIPGVSGVGLKTAIALIQYFQNLESLFDNLGDVELILERGASRIRKTLEQSREIAFLSRTLATIKTDVPL